MGLSFPFLQSIWGRHCLLLIYLGYGLDYFDTAHSILQSVTSVITLTVYPLTWVPAMEMPAHKMPAHKMPAHKCMQTVFYSQWHTRCFACTSCSMTYCAGSWNGPYCEAHVFSLQCLCSLFVICPQQQWKRIRRCVMIMPYRGHELNMFHQLSR